MALEAEDLIANAKNDLSQAIILLLARRNYYQDNKRSTQYKETNCQIMQLKTALNAIEQNILIPSSKLMVNQ
tara:strand:- start:731 stop:946 length:216 start_codon:yes stop_codon:yes gene_type:complete